MKARIVLLLLVCLSCTVVAHENGDDFISPWGQISFTGHWKGDDSEDKGHRSMPFIPVTASLENSIISLYILLVLWLPIFFAKRKPDRKTR